MAIFVNGPRFSGNHALAQYLRMLGMDRYPAGPFVNGYVKDKRGGKNRCDPWDWHIKQIKLHQFATSHSQWSPNLHGHTILQTRRDPIEVTISYFRRRVSAGVISCTKSAFKKVLNSDAFYHGTAELDSWDDVPDINIIQFDEQFTEAGRRRICKIVGKSFDPKIDHWGQGHNFSGGNSSIHIPPFNDWWCDEYRKILLDRWDYHRETQRYRTRQALAFHGVRSL